VSLLDDLVFYIRRAQGIPDAWRSEVENLTHEKFRSRARGGWLLDLVIGAAAEFYGIDRGAYVLDADIVKDVELRIEGLARVVAREGKDAGEIAALARKELDRRIRDGYLARMARNVWRDLWRHEKRQEKLEGDPAKADKAAYTNWARKPQYPEARIPDAERDERLRMVFGPGSAGPPHEMLAFAWLGMDRSTTGRTPQAVVEDLATLTLPQLAESWVQCFAAIEEREPAEVEALFKGMIDKARGRPKRFFKYWNPLVTIDRWVIKVEETDISDPNRTRKQPLHMRIAYLYKTKLGYSTERIAAELGPRRLDQLLADFVPEFADRESRMPERVRAELERFLEPTNKGTEPLSRLYKPHRKVINWQYNVSRRIRTAEYSQLRLALGIIVSERIEPWKIMAFLHCRCLGKTPLSVAKEYGPKPLDFMRDGLVREFAERWDSTPDYVRRSIPSLIRMLLAQDKPPSLETCPRELDLAEALRAWSEEVRKAVEHEFGSNPSLRLFALRHGLPNRVRETVETSG
jgi:hypothetical protein